MKTCPERVLCGSANEIRGAFSEWAAMPVDQEMPADAGWKPDLLQTTLARPFSVTGPGTFRARATQTLNFLPCEEDGWWIERTDLPDSLPIRVDASNVWMTARNIVLCSGSPHNYMRMVEHFVALRLGTGLDNVLIRAASGDPPLLDSSSLEMVESIESAGLVTRQAPVRYVTVKEPVCAGGPGGSFLALFPLGKGEKPMLKIDCGVNFKSAIGKQRIRFDLTRECFKHGSFARTNTTLGMMLYCKTIGRIFADIRNLGYTRENILIAGRNSYLNQPRMIHKGKSLEAVWHRASLDLLAALSLVGSARIVGTVVSYKAGHSLDVHTIKMLYKNRLLVPVE